MKREYVVALLAAYFCVSSTVAATIAVADDVLTVHATGASSRISPRDPGQLQIVLQPLDVTVTVSFSCATGASAESITLSIADEHIHFDAGKIADKTTLEVAMRLPADQIPPISSADFCIADAPSKDEELIVPGIASAQVSLRCHGPNGTSMHFASIPLPMSLRCEPDENQGAWSDK